MEGSMMGLNPIIPPYIVLSRFYRHKIYVSFSCSLYENESSPPEHPLFIDGWQSHPSVQKTSHHIDGTQQTDAG